ncbi:MAG: RsmB/NOP family class I SAM-dependent RNA methyltransferase [Desulfurococcaceae archaeon]
MEKPIPIGQASLFLKLLLNYILATRVSYDKAFKSIIKRYSFSKWLLPFFYKLGYNVVMNYYAIRWLSSRYGYGTRVGGIVDFLVRKGLSIKIVLDEVRDYASSLAPVKRISLIYSYPEFLVRNLLSRLDQNIVEKMLASLNERKRWLRLNTLIASRERALECLEETGVEYETNVYLPYIVRIKSDVWKPIGRNKCVSEGMVIPQDLSSALIIESIKPFKTPFLDACSSPGVKLSQIIGLSKRDLQVLAVDLSIKRIEAEKKLLIKTNALYPGIILLNTDSSNIVFTRRFEQCLIDAPCSGLGVVYSDPAVKLNITQNKILYYQNIQLNILKNLINVCNELIYTTCSIHPAEGEEVIEKICSIHGDKLIFRKLKFEWFGEAYSGYSVSKNTYRIHPFITNSGGFYIAYIEKQ